jgi:cysteinyl-tRNA synthetase
MIKYKYILLVEVIMKLYNTLTRKIEEFIPYEENKVKMYTCGPTVYHYAHIGNIRTYIMEDILEKTLSYLGYKVTRVMNITDVGHLSSDSDTGDDKMIKSAQREHKSVLEIAKFYTDEFFKDAGKVNIKTPEIIAPATENVDEYIKIIAKLLENGYAYQSNGNIYFDVSKLNDYYQLTNHKEDEMVVGVREGVEEDKGKRNQSDFVLWFTKSKFEDQELKWNSPWGYGYPGWHIECSGISMKYLGEYLDIHCGGVDNIFPHHTNEIAQSECFLGHKWCKHWFHSEHLNDESGKMSKSKGALLTISLLEENAYNPLAYRLFCLQSHYRKQLVFSFESLDGAQTAYNKLLSKIKSIKEGTEGIVDEDAVSDFQKQFKEALENDLNTSLALTTLYDVLKADISNKTKLYLIEDFDKVLSLDLLKENKNEIDEELKTYIDDMITKRNNAKKDGRYEEADKIREELLSKGIVLKDTREGTMYEVK